MKRKALLKIRDWITAPAYRWLKGDKNTYTELCFDLYMRIMEAIDNE